MGQVISRRGFVSGVVGGALILGFDPLRRSWVTQADASSCPCADLPPLDGELRTVAIEPYAADFGRIISRQPQAVLIPGSVNDIVKIVCFARAHDLKVAANGQAGTDDMRESHSNFGQSQVQAGIVIDMKPLNSVFAVQADYADVAAGVHWSTVLDAALAVGKTPPVLNDYMHLSVGGTLSVGGIGGTSLHFGAQIDNVLSLEVVTGRGDRVRCSRNENRDLFEAVLGGGGQCGIIVRAKLRLLPARTQAKVYTLMYDDINLYVADQRMLLREGRFSYLQGQVVRNGADTAWRFMIEAAAYYTPPAQPNDTVLLAGLRGTELTTTVLSYRDWQFRLDPTVAFLKSIGVWQLPHPWVTLFFPASQAVGYMTNVLATLTLADTGQGPVLFYPFDTDRMTRPLFQVPAPREAFHLSVLRTGAPPTPAVIDAMLAGNRTLYDQAVAVGGTRYIIGAIPGFTQADWRAHFGSQWDDFRRAKQQFDPDNVLTPGQGMFPG
jgi:cytokinin dehydrogenase